MRIEQVGGVTLVQGDALELLKEFPDRSINCCVTSPPYWGLRVYGTWKMQTLWGDLAHFAKPRNAKKSARWWLMIRWRAHLKGGVFSQCKRSWIGAFGLEPTPFLYVEHAVMMFREVRRVLRDDGTLFLNLGDSYTGGGRGGGAKDSKQRS